MISCARTSPQCVRYLQKAREPSPCAGEYSMIPASKPEGLLDLQQTGRRRAGAALSVFRCEYTECGTRRAADPTRCRVSCTTRSKSCTIPRRRCMTCLQRCMTCHGSCIPWSKSRIPCSKSRVTCLKSCMTGSKSCMTWSKSCMTWSRELVIETCGCGSKRDISTDNVISVYRTRIEPTGGRLEHSGTS